MPKHKQIQVGSTALVRLYDGREVEAKVTRIVDSSGTKGPHRIRPHSLEDRPGADHPRGSMLKSIVSLRGPMIQTEPEDIEQICERLRKMSDIDLLRYGQASRIMADPKNNQGNPNPAFQVQLDEARAAGGKRRMRTEVAMMLAVVRYDSRQRARQSLGVWLPQRYSKKENVGGPSSDH
jgi:hypothetical protein